MVLIYGILNIQATIVCKYSFHIWVLGRSFFVLNYKVFDYIKDDNTLFERQPMEKLASEEEPPPPQPAK